MKELVGAALLTGTLVGSPLVAEAELDWREVRVVKQKDATAVANCEYRGQVRDDDMEDVLKKAVKVDADTVVTRPGQIYKDYIFADVYRCGEDVMPLAGSPASAGPALVERAPQGTLEEELQRLSALRQQRKITEEEYALLRKRLLDTFPVGQPVVSRRSQEASRKSPQVQAGAVRPTSPPAPRLPAQLAELIGTWHGVSRGDYRGLRPTTVRIFETGVKVHWSMTRGCAGGESGESKGSGLVTVSEEGITLSGTYQACDDFYFGLARPAKIVFSLTRKGKMLEGSGVGQDQRLIELSLTKESKR